MISFDKHPVLIAVPEYWQSILGFVVLVVHVLCISGGPAGLLVI